MLILIHGKRWMKLKLNFHLMKNSGLTEEILIVIC